MSSAGSPHDSDHLRDLVDAIRVGILVADDDGNYVDANARACELLGRSRGEILAMSIGELVPEDARDELERQWQAFLRDGEQSGVIELLLPDGSLRPLRFQARADFAPGLHCSLLTELPPAPADRSAETPDLTVCAWTKKVRYDGEWVTLEDYLYREHGILVSHGLSPGALHGEET